MTPNRTVRSAGRIAVVVAAAAGIALGSGLVQAGRPDLVRCGNGEDSAWSSDTSCNRSALSVASAQVPASRPPILEPAPSPPPSVRPPDTLPPVQVSHPPAPASWQPNEVWFEEDFSAYATTDDLLRYPNPKWSGANEDVNVRRIALDSLGPPVGGKSMRYTFPDRTNDRRLCHDYTIGRNLTFPVPVTEVWVEMWVKFSSNFETKVPGGQCRGLSDNGYKFIFGRCRGGTCGRFEIKVGNGDSHHQTVYAPGLAPKRSSQVIPISTDRLPFRRVVDDQWHCWRLHMKVGPSGRLRAWFDNTLLYDSSTDPSQRNRPISAASIYGLGLGRNMNQGPVAAQTLHWGRVRAWRTDPGGW